MTATRTQPGSTALGGGHGLHASLSALRRLPVDLTAVVTVADDGGSSGRLRSEFGVLPPGDLRMALAALCGDDEWGETWASVLQHRFAGTGEMRGHVVGNLLIVSLLGAARRPRRGPRLGRPAAGRARPGAADGAHAARHHRRGQRPRPRRSRRAHHGARPGGGGDRRRRHRVDRAAARRPAALPRGGGGGPRRRPGRARPGLVVHLGAAPPDGPVAAPGPGGDRRPPRRRPQPGAPGRRDRGYAAGRPPRRPPRPRARPAASAPSWSTGPAPSAADRPSSRPWPTSAARGSSSPTSPATTAPRGTTRRSWRRRTPRSWPGSEPSSDPVEAASPSLVRPCRSTPLAQGHPRLTRASALGGLLTHVAGSAPWR